LTAPHWRVMSGGHIQVESKDDIRKRLGRSTDYGDAVVMAFYDDAGNVNWGSDELASESRWGLEDTGGRSRWRR
jgi:hypothetical protein